MAQHVGNVARVRDFTASHVYTHDVGLRVDVPSGWLSANNIESFTLLDENQIEYVIPRELFDRFNQFPRYPWDPWK